MLAHPEVAQNKTCICGVVELKGANAVFVDPVRLSSASYCCYRIDEAEYYSRSLDFAKQESQQVDILSAGDGVGSNPRKRKRNNKKSARLNEKEILAEARHQQVREVISKAHEAYQGVGSLRLAKDVEPPVDAVENKTGDQNLDFVKLADLWQAPLYTITLAGTRTSANATEVSGEERDIGGNTHRLFKNLIANENPEEVIAECSGCQFVVPRNCKFFISDIKEVQQLVPLNAWDGYNLLLLDPPWENKSVQRKSLYPTLPNRYLLSLPIKRLAHSGGALLGLWVTNREKLLRFVENELFPNWGVVPAASWYWLKVTNDRKMLSPLDLAHHKPYECLLLGYVRGAVDETKKTATKDVLDDALASSTRELPDKHVIISVPGDHSRKPAVGSLLLEYAPGPWPVRALELFARELNAGWTSWGNEPLHFQSLKYFKKVVDPLEKPLLSTSC